MGKGKGLLFISPNVVSLDLEGLGIPRNYLPGNFYCKSCVPESLCHREEWIARDLSTTGELPSLIKPLRLLVRGRRGMTERFAIW